MKYSKLFIGLFACTLLSVANASAQQTATDNATANATIVQPIAISKTSNMNFGNIAVSASSGGSVVISPSGTRTPSGGVTLPVSGSNPASAASFTVTGANNYTYSITLPSGSVSMDDGNLHTMSVNNFTSNGVSGVGTLNGSGSQTLNVGATLTVTAAQAAGIYSTAVPFDVTVNYN